MLSVYQKLLVAFVVAFILIVAKAGLVYNLEIYLILPMLILGYFLLCAISIPLAAAFFILSAQLIAQVSLAYADVSVFGIISVSVLVAMFVIRWYRGSLIIPSYLNCSHLTPLILLGFVFAIGFFGAFQWQHGNYAGIFPENLLHIENKSLHYVFLSHWIIYIAIGVLACTQLEELKMFLVSFSLFFIVTIFPLPLEFYAEYFNKIYYLCEPVGLHSREWAVNRSHVGYISAIASLISLSFANCRTDNLKYIFYFWFLLSACVTLLAGSKGPVIGFACGLILVMLYANRLSWIRCSIFAAGIASAVGVSSLAGYSLIPCGTVAQYTANVSHSISTRNSLHAGALNIFLKNRDINTILFGYGLGKPATATDPEKGGQLKHSGSHNLFLDLLVDTGVIGLSLFLFAIYLLLGRFISSLKRVSSYNNALIMTATSGSLIVVFVMLMFATSTYREYLGAFLIGLLVGSDIYLVKKYQLLRGQKV